MTVIDAATGAVLDEAMVEAGAARYAGHRPGAVFALLPTEIPAIAGYLGALRAGRPVAPLDPGLDRGMLLDLIERFAPALVTGVLGAPPEGYLAEADTWVRRTPAAPVHPELALLLTTSGSTGDPKLVRLSRSAIRANAAAIAEVLDITAAEVAITTLPLFYSYGLSVLHSHLLCGATVVLERTGLMQRDFWTAALDHGVTSMAFVPYQYEMLRRLRFDPARYPMLRTLTQAGGRLRTDLVTDFAQRMAAAGGRLFVMYGQTEAGPRIATLPAERIADKLGSVGRALPGGAFTVEDGEVVYRGPNVMLGYAHTAADLARGDDQGGVLRTGDLGRLDADGYLFLTGRTRRMAKVFGVRINLDDVERNFPVVALAGDDTLTVVTEGGTDDDARTLRGKIAEWLGTHFTGVTVRRVDALPLLPNGKIDYRALEAST